MDAYDNQSNQQQGASQPPPVWNSSGPASAPPRASVSDFAPLPIQSIAPKPAKARSSRALNVLLGFAMVVALGGVAFAAGRCQRPGGRFHGRRIPRHGRRELRARRRRPGSRIRLGGLTGTVTAVTPTGITIAVGQTTVNVATDGSTTYHTQAPGSASDVTVGSTVQVQFGRPAHRRRRFCTPQPGTRRHDAHPGSGHEHHGPGPVEQRRVRSLTTKYGSGAGYIAQAPDSAFRPVAISLRRQEPQRQGHQRPPARLRPRPRGRRPTPGASPPSHPTW